MRKRNNHSEILVFWWLRHSALQSSIYTYLNSNCDPLGHVDALEVGSRHSSGLLEPSLTKYVKWNFPENGQNVRSILPSSLKLRDSGKDNTNFIKKIIKTKIILNETQSL